MNKYRARKAVVHGITFDSKREAACYQELKLLDRAGEISCLRLQPSYPIIIGGIQVRYPSGREAKYTADFEYTDWRTGKKVIEDVKAHATKTEAYRLRVALMHTMGMQIVEV